jgi:hypothetical protein
VTEANLLPDQLDRIASVVELRRFRHFTRYYYELDYDWARLDYLSDVYRRTIPLVRRDLARFRAFLEQTLA